MKTLIHDSIEMELPFRFRELTELSVSWKADDHVCARITGRIDEEALEACMQLQGNDHINILVLDGNRERLIFSGLPISVKVSRSEQPEVRLEAADRSILLDVENKTRSFQRKDLKRTGMMREILSEYGGDLMVCGGEGEELLAPVIQYQETDWELIKRLASDHGRPVFPSAVGNHPQIYLGLKDGDRREASEDPVRMEKPLGEYLRFRERANVLETNFLECVIRSPSLYQLGDTITCGETDLQIYEMSAALKRGRLSYEYRLGRKEGLLRQPRPNPRLKGTMLTGTILDVKPNHLRLHLDVDRNLAAEAAHWYPWKRTDWYCMPEKGGAAALYFPENEEALAYVTAVHRTDGEENEKTRKPEVKYMDTAAGKQMKLEQDRLSFHADDGKITMNLSEGGGVRFISNGRIEILAGPSFCASGAEISLESGERIRLSTRKTDIVMDDIIQLKG